jgi:hypothetical protein
MKPFTYVLKGSGKQCTATIIRPDGHGVDIATFTSERDTSRTKARAKKWAEKRVAYYNANFPELTGK